MNWQVTYRFKNMKEVILKLTYLVLFKKLEAALLNDMLRNFSKFNCMHDRWEPSPGPVPKLNPPPPPPPPQSDKKGGPPKW